MRTFVRGLGAAGLLLFLACAFTPLPNRLAQWRAPAPRLEPAGAIVVLGAGALPDGSLGLVSLGRTIHGIRLYRRGLAPLLVLLGQPAQGEVPSESLIRAGLARELGVAEGALLTATAWTTRDEAAQAHAILATRGVRRILLVSEGQHLVRAGRLFGRAGFEVLPAPDDGTFTAEAPEERLGLTREILAELAARLVGGVR